MNANELRESIKKAEEFTKIYNCQTATNILDKETENWNNEILNGNILDHWAIDCTLYNDLIIKKIIELAENDGFICDECKK